MWKAFQRFRALEPETRGIFLRGAVLLPLISLGLRVCGFRATQAFLQGLLSSFGLPRSSGPASANTTETVQNSARMVRAAARRIGGTTCLEESLTLWWLLRRRGIASSIRIGMRKVAGRFEAHAWVECGGVALNDESVSHQQYAAFDAAFPLSALERSSASAGERARVSFL